MAPWPMASALPSSVSRSGATCVSLGGSEEHWDTDDEGTPPTMTDWSQRIARIGAVACLCLAGCGTADETGSPTPVQADRQASVTTAAPPSPVVSVSQSPRKVTTKPTARPSAKPSAKVSAKPAPSGIAPAKAAAKPSPSARPTPAPTPTPDPLPKLGMGVNFQLSDQFDKPHSVQFPRQQPTVLAFGDKDGSNQIEGWIKPLYERYTDRIDIQGVAQLDMVPAFARGMVRGIMGSLTTNPVMLDWDGTVSKAFGYAGGGQAGIYVVDGDGAIRWRTTGAATTAGLTAAQDVVDQLLAD